METQFINAKEMHLKNPKTFEVPTEEELKAIEQHTTVKVCTGDERFWTEIIRIEGEKLIAIVVNQLINTEDHGLVFGDTVEFTKDNIYSIY